jgi:hypothetical protein
MLDAAGLDRLAAGLRGSAAGEVSSGDRRLSRERRRALGAFFTPQPLVDYVVDATLAPLWARGVGRRGDGTPELRVLDPAAGDGRFLAAAARWLAARAGCDVRDVVRRCVVGIERDSRFAAAAREALGPGAVVDCAEALLDPPDVGAVDAVIGNPPYLRSIHLERTDRPLWTALRGKFAATSYKEWDLYAAFLEQSLRWLARGGHVGLVVPSRWLTAAFAEPLRGELAASGAVRGVIDFGAWQIFDGATTYASVAFLGDAPTRSVFVGRWTGAGWRCGEIDAGTLDAGPWRLATGDVGAMLDEWSAAGRPLGEVARIAKGVGTNADRVFVIEAGVSRALGEPVDLEPEMTRTVLRGRDVRAYGDADPEVRLLYPYDRDGRLIPLASLPPRTRAYLSRCRDALEARERGRFRGPDFHQLGRPQNLAFLADPAPKIVVPDVTREGRAMLDTTGAMVLDSAYAIRPLPGAGVSIGALLDLLNSPVVSVWLRETGLRLRGDYVRMKTAYLATLPVIPRDVWPADAPPTRI